MAEIESLQEEDLSGLLGIVKDFRLRNIKIDAPEDFLASLDED